ncbi:MAG: sigma-70 family RNA polymerase sigma factor [Planctomycetes bacterium]|nr:sigma-70 family RNA polymerase sigma factor [Planctomycetota bacterium]
MLTGPPDNPRDISGGLPSTISTGLLRSVRQNDQEAWARMVSVYYPMAYGWCRRAGLQPSDAADVCQEVFAGIAAGIGAFRREKPSDTFRGWVRRITQRRIIDFRQRGGSLPVPMGVGHSDDRLRDIPAGGMSDSGSPQPNRQAYLRDALELARAEFENTTWQAFWRSTVDGVAGTDVARELAISANAVYLAKSRVLRRLREILRRGASPE